MSDLFVPFNNNPVSVEVKFGSYTIPAGKYARVTASVSARAWGRGAINGGGSALQYIQNTSDSESKTATFFVPSGTSLSVTNTNASDTVSGNNTGNSLKAEDYTIATFSIDGTMCLEVYARGISELANNGPDATNYIDATVSGDSHARYIVELYNEQT